MRSNGIWHTEYIFFRNSSLLCRAIKQESNGICLHLLSIIIGDDDVSIALPGLLNRGRIHIKLDQDLVIEA